MNFNQKSNYIIVKNTSNNSLSKTDSWVSISSLDSLSTKDIIELDHIYIIINYDATSYKNKYLAFSSYNKCKKYIEKKYNKMKLVFGVNDEKHIKDECVLYYNDNDKMLFNINDIPQKISVIIIFYPNADIKYLYIDNDDINTYINDVIDYYKNELNEYIDNINKTSQYSKMIFSSNMVIHKTETYYDMVVHNIEQKIINNMTVYTIIQNITII